MIASAADWPDDAKTRIENALKRLATEYRTVLVLKDMEGQTYETIAEVLQMPISTVRSRLHQARLELAKLLKREKREQR